MKRGVARAVRQSAGAALLLATTGVGSVPAAQPAEPSAPAEPIPFVAHTIDADVPSGYQVVITDLSGDGRPDIVALATRQPDLVWYESPHWERHVIATGLDRMINVAAHDIDGDGRPELALAHGFTTVYDESPGIISLLESGDDPRRPWSMREIDRAPTTHRLRWADIDGRGAKVLVNAPLIGPGSVRPDFTDTLALLWYRPADWQRRVLTDAERGVVHGVGVGPWDDPGRDAVLSASFQGVHLHEFADGGWTRTRLADGDPSAWPESGASEAQAGRLGAERFVTTIEPWHGHQVVVYRRTPGSPAGEWARQVVDASIEDGHTLVTADLDGDGRDEIIAGERSGRTSVYLYRVDPGAGTWSRQLLDDGGMGASGCAAHDMNADARPDVICIGSRTANLKWYENAGR